jgi:hypothetical protein
VNISHCRAASSSIVLGASGDPLITRSRVVDDGLDDITADGDENVEYFAVCRVGDRRAMQVLHDERTTAAVANVR